LRKVIPLLRATDPFPPIELANDDGLLCAGADLSPQRLLDAYSRGIFPWYSGGDPILWWSPNPRMVLFTSEFRTSERLRRRVRSGKFDVCVNTAFRDVMKGCAAPRSGQDGTWITDEMIDAYSDLHRLGYAHSVETWRDGNLVGGLYGIAVGRMFFGESMFSRETDASKVALVALIEQMRRTNMPMIDCQQETGHLASLGARPIPRETFAEKLRELIPRIEKSDLMG
jgi:leucyl/phenylalanyl-tRNA--protein transferase